MTPEPTMDGFDYTGELPVLKLNYTSDIQWTYTVAEIVASGVIIGNTSAGPSNSTSTSQGFGTMTPTGTDSSAILSSGVPSTTMLTITTSPSSARGSNSATIKNTASSTAPLSLCENFADPDNGVSNICQCSSGTTVTKLPLLTGRPDQCGYTTLPSPAPTPAPTSNSNPHPYTYTDIESGIIIACKSSSTGNAGGYLYTNCEGDSTTISTDPVIYSRYTSVETAGASTSAVSAAALASSAATAIPTGACAYWDDSLFWTFEVFNINGWAGNDGDDLHHQEHKCGALTG